MAAKLRTTGVSLTGIWRICLCALCHISPAELAGATQLMRRVCAKLIDAVCEMTIHVPSFAGLKTRASENLPIRLDLRPMIQSEATPATEMTATVPQRVSLRGAVRIGDAGALHETALSLVDGGGDVVVSCADAEYVDTSALQILLSLKQALGREGRTLTILDVPQGLELFWRFAGVGSLLLP